MGVDKISIIVEPQLPENAPYPIIAAAGSLNKDIFDILNHYCPVEVIENCFKYCVVKVLRP